jgi:hypothetical protein
MNDYSESESSRLSFRGYLIGIFGWVVMFIGILLTVLSMVDTESQNVAILRLGIGMLCLAWPVFLISHFLHLRAGVEQTNEILSSLLVAQSGKIGPAEKPSQIENRKVSA